MFWGHSIGRKNRIFTPQDTAPANISPITISGGTGIDEIITATPGTWSGIAPIAFSYQWKRDAVNISGETGLTYTTVLADDGTALTCVETAINSLGSNSEISNSLSIADGSNPGELTNLQAWIYADEGYIDQSGNGHTFTNNGTTINSGALNGLDTYVMDGASWIGLPDSALGKPANYTVWACFKYTSAGAVQNLFGSVASNNLANHKWGGLELNGGSSEMRTYFSDSLDFGESAFSQILRS